MVARVSIILFVGILFFFPSDLFAQDTSGASEESFAIDSSSKSAWKRKYSVNMEIGGSAMTCRQNTCSVRTGASFYAYEMGLFASAQKTGTKFGGDVSVVGASRGFHKAEETYSVVFGKTYNIFEFFEGTKNWQGVFTSIGLGGYSSKEKEFHYTKEIGSQGNPIYRDDGSTSGETSKGVAIMGELGGESSMLVVNMGLKLEFVHHIPLGKGTAFSTGTMQAIRFGFNF
jgi:hypothetical protein